MNRVVRTLPPWGQKQRRLPIFALTSNLHLFVLVVVEVALLAVGVHDPLVLVDVLLLVRFRDSDVGVEGGGGPLIRDIARAPVEIQVTIPSRKTIEGMLRGLDVRHGGARLGEGGFEDFVA